MNMTKTHLRELATSGQKLTRIQQLQVDAELARVCQHWRCDNSLAFRNTGAEYCSNSHRISQAKHLQTVNRRKRRQYNKTHGVTRKEPKRVVRFDPRHGTALADTDVLLYENYKEPLKKVEKGFGYYGTLAMSSDRTSVQCHICGNLFEVLSQHIKIHKIGVRDYKERYGLGIGTALIGEEFRESLQARTFVISAKTGLPAHLVEYNRKVQSGEIQHKGGNTGGFPLDRRNKLGICADQVLDKIRELQEKLGRIPSYEDFSAEYRGRYMSSIRFYHGTYSDAVRKVAGKTRGDLFHPVRDDLVAALVEFNRLHGRIPMTSDFNRGLLRDKGVYIRVFGSLNNARLEAGLDAVLPLPFGQIVQLSPDEYMEYKRTGKAAGYVPSANAEKMRRRKERQRGQLRLSEGMA